MMKRIFVFIFLLGSLPALAGFTNLQKPPLKTIVIDPGHGGLDGGARGSVSREAIIALEIGLRVRDLLKEQLPDLNVLMTRESDVLPGPVQNKNAALNYRASFANQNNADLFVSIHLNASMANQRYGRRQIGSREEKYYVYQGKGKKKKKITKTRVVPIYERYKLPASVKGTQTYILARDWYERKVKAAGQKAANDNTVTSDSTGEAQLDIDPIQLRILAQQYAKYYFQKSLTLATYCEQEFAQIGRNSWGVQQRDWEGIAVLQATQMPSILIETGFVDYPDEEEYLHSEKGRDEMAQAIVNAIKHYKENLEASVKAASGK